MTVDARGWVTISQEPRCGVGHSVYDTTATQLEGRMRRSVKCRTSPLAAPEKPDSVATFGSSRTGNPHHPKLLHGDPWLFRAGPDSVWNLERPIDNSSKMVLENKWEAVSPITLQKWPTYWKVLGEVRLITQDP